MAHFADLTRCTYSGRDYVEGGDEDLSVGWLERGHEFARGDVPAGLADALLLCATRPVRLFRGFHTCDLCPPSSDPLDVQRTTMQLPDGREVALGNGEIRVRAMDDRWYTAPTLVAHYVAAHGYVPPAPFVAAVLHRAAELYVLSGPQLNRLTALSVEDQLDVCIRAIGSFPTCEPAALAAVCARLRMRDDAPLGMDDEMDVLPGQIADACLEVAYAFSRDEPVLDEERQARTRACLIHVLELASDLGIDATAF